MVRTPLLAAAAAAVFGVATIASAAAFDSANLVVIQAAASANNTTASVLELTKTTQTSPVQTLAINGTAGSDALRFSGSATSTLYLSTTADRSLITFNGVNSTTTSVNVNTIAARGVGTFDKDGAFNLATTYTGTLTGNPQTRAATSLNNAAYYIADQNGLYTNGASAPSPASNIRNIRTFGGSVFTNQASSTTTTIQVGTVSATTGGSITGLPGLTNNANIQDFYLIQSGTNGTTYDVLYTLSATSNTAGTIAKYSLVSGSWVANGTVSTANGGFGLAVEDTATGADLYYTTGLGALTANTVIRISDTTGYNTGISLGTGTAIYTSATGTILKGVEFAPIPEPASLSMLAMGALAGLRRRRQA